MARKPFRFGLIGKAKSREEWIEQAKKAEELGYASFLASDHLYWEFSLIGSDQIGTARKVAWVREAAGSRFEELELSIPILTVALTETEKDRLEAVKPLAALSGVSAEALLETIHNLVGSEDQICEELLERRERYGFSYITTTITNAEQMAPIVARLAGH